MRQPVDPRLAPCHPFRPTGAFFCVLCALSRLFPYLRKSAFICGCLLFCGCLACICSVGIFAGGGAIGLDLPGSLFRNVDRAACR